MHVYYKRDKFLIGLNKRQNIKAILVSDSFFKIIFKALVLFWPSFLFYRSKSSILKEKEFVKIAADIELDYANIDAFYWKASRKPERIYIWHTSGGRKYFTKIIFKGDYCDPEFEAAKIVHLRTLFKEITFFDLILLAKRRLYTALTYESLPLEVLREREPISSKPIFYEQLAELHPDLNSENIFAIKNKIYVVDLEAVVCK